MNLAMPTIVLVVVNLGLLWLLMAAPIGRRTLVVRRNYDATTKKIWSAIHPQGAEAGWHPFLIGSEVLEDGRLVRQSLTHLDRKGLPIQRTIEITGTETTDDAERFGISTRIVEDSALDQSFWASYSERRTVEMTANGTSLVIEQTDKYRGLAFMIFRYFAMRREMRALDLWLKTGKAEMSGWFEHPATQVLLAIISTLLLWPFFGFSSHGLILSTQLTVVIVLHELGHMAAYRAFGHKSARMIVLPLLGGIAIGGRPYATLFEVATCALMGAGVSAFMVPIIIAIYSSANLGVIDPSYAGMTLTFLLILGSFNILNLLPMYRFDGGQVLRQLFRDRNVLTLASFAVTGGLIWVGWRIGIPSEGLLAGLSVFVLLSLLGSSGVKPRDVLPDMTPGERLITGFGFYAALAIHGYAIVYACDRLFAGL